MPKILIIHAGFGQGHRQAALAIASYLKAPCYDLLDFIPRYLRRANSNAYLYISKNHPCLWKVFYDLSQYKIIHYLLYAANRLVYFRFIAYLEKTKPDIVIATHFFPPQLVNTVKDKLGITQISVVTDIKPHSLWANPGVDKFFVPAAESKYWLGKLGIEKNKIIAGYVPIRQGFLREESKRQLYRKFGLDSSKQSILFVSSLSGNFSFREETIKTLAREFNLLIIYGKNKQLRDYLRKINLNNIKSFYFYDKIWELISISSLIVTKPGGLTVFEGGYKKKLFIFTHFIPGQEEENMKFLKQYGVAESAFGSRALLKAVKTLIRKEKPFPGKYPLEFKDIRIPLKKLIFNYGKNS